MKNPTPSGFEHDTRKYVDRCIEKLAQLIKLDFLVYKDCSVKPLIQKYVEDNLSELFCQCYGEGVKNGKEVQNREIKNLNEKLEKVMKANGLFFGCNITSKMNRNFVLDSKGNIDHEEDRKQHFCDYHGFLDEQYLKREVLDLLYDICKNELNKRFYTKEGDIILEKFKFSHKIIQDLVIKDFCFPGCEIFVPGPPVDGISIRAV